MQSLPDQTDLLPEVVAHRDKLCAALGPTDLDCRVEGADFTRHATAPKDEIVLCAYNVERDLRLDDQFVV